MGTKSELCRNCGECCKVMVLPLQKSFKIKRLAKYTKGSTNDYLITIKCSKQAAEQLSALIDCIAKNGNVGHSFGIIVDPDDKEKRKEFGFDGDGNARITEMEIKDSEEKSVEKSIMTDWLNIRGCEVIKETDKTIYVKINNPCPNLIKSEDQFICNVYSSRPEGCRIFDGRNYDFLDCVWKNNYVILEKAVPYTRVRRGKLERVKGSYLGAGLYEKDLWKKLGYTYAPVSVEGQILALLEKRQKLNPEKDYRLISGINTLMDKLSRTLKIYKAGRIPGWIGPRKFVGKTEKKRMSKRRSRERKKEKVEETSLYGSPLED